MAQLLEELTADFGRGMLDDLSAIRYPNNAAELIENGRIFPDGSCGRRQGWKRTHAAALGVGVGFGGIEFVTAAGVRQLISFLGDEMFVSEDTGVTWVDKTPRTMGISDLSTGYYDFATMRVGATTYLFCANGGTLWRWDGTTMAATPNAPSGFKFIAVFNARIWGTGHSGVLVQASRVGDPTSWSTPFGLTVQVSTHDGDVPTGLFQIGPHLLVFDRNSTSYIDGFGEATIIVAEGATGFSRSVGCEAFRTIVAVGDNGACWWSERGIEYYAPGQGIRLVSRGLQRFLTTINRLAIKENPGMPSGVYNPVTQEYHVALSTTGVQNDASLVINLLQQGRGWLGAPSIDRQQAGEAVVSELLFGEDAEGYLTVDAGGVGLISDAFGYATLAGVGDNPTPIIEDADGYLDSAITEGVSATLFLGSSEDRSSVLYSLGYDGFVRRHEGDLDDQLADGTGGLDVTMTIDSKPFLFRQPRQRKRVRALHVAGIADSTATVTVAARANGVLEASRTLTINSTTGNQPKRAKARIHSIGDAPQVRLQTTDDVRIALLGMTAELLREPV